MDEQKTSGFAITSLVLGIASLVLVGVFYIGVVTSILGIVFGILALRDIKMNNKKGKGMAIAGIILGILSIIFFVVATVVLTLMVQDQISKAGDNIDLISQLSNQ